MIQYQYFFFIFLPQPETEGEVSKSSQASASQSSSTESMDAEVLSPEPNASMTPMDIMSVVEHKLNVDMPKTPPNTWTVSNFYAMVEFTY